MRILSAIAACLLLASCSGDKVTVNIPDDGPRIAILEAEQAIIKSRLDLLESQYSELTEVHEYLLEVIESLEESVENNTTSITNINTQIQNIYNDLEDLEDALENDSNCSLEIRDLDENTNRADMYIVCDAGEYKLRNNAKLED